MKEKAEAAGRPGPAHKVLNALVGHWKAEVKCWFDPDAPPKVSHATATGAWIMSSRYLQEDFRGETMGRLFHGRTLTGFDNVKQTFQSIWISDVQTSMIFTEGKGDRGNKLITFEGTASCPATGRADIPTRVVRRILGPNKNTFEMFYESRDGNRKIMEIVYTRP